MRTLTLFVVSSLLAGGIASAQETIDFEGPPAGAIVTSVPSSIGAVQVSASPTAAIIFDSNLPPGIDFDLGSPNNMCPDPPGAGPGVGPGGQPGAVTDGNLTENCPLVPLDNVLIVADNLTDGNNDGLVDVPNDLADSAAMMTFVWPAPVTISSMMLLDVESSEGAARIDLFTDAAGNDLLTSFVLDKTGDNGLRVFDLGQNFGAVRMEVFLFGSGAIDNIVFTPCDQECDDLDACTNDECDPSTGLCVNTAIDCTDQDLCTIDSCDPGTGLCVHTSRVCNDNDGCTVDFCDPITGMCDSMQRSCDDGNDCTTDECVEGQCQNMAIDCDDGDDCTVDECIDGTCSSIPIDCDDDDPCTNDFCEGGVCFNPDNGECVLECRVTGGGHDEFDDHRYTFGTQGGAPNQFSGEWTHHEQHGPDGQRFMFHAGTNSAPPETEIHIVACSDPGFCAPARHAPAKQIDLAGVGSFRNLHNPTDDLDSVVVRETLHWVTIHVEDLGEPGNTGRRGNAIQSRDARNRGGTRRPFAGGQDDVGPECPPEGSSGGIAPCTCPDFYHIRIYEGYQPGEQPNTTDVIYEVYGYIDGGNFQIHPRIGG